ncbi:glycine zipper 2TM domain-containing protein [Aquabacterium sp.]|uniref:glycine zipper 2TM domain-containing protein n=1 Tax=Aquabacterium sp. TaxID=1872578 RepID=UPI002489F52D|nr:glycine zipper 2TM domain-containing protein [Aquabacterium sp.]MDI1260889.1 glycine zipper 2TM domain-containing protein [Aquabacterium sp.]
MNLPSRLSVLILALAAALPLTVATSAHAQTAATVTADSFGVEQVRALTPGTELAFRLTATPGSEVTLQIGGASSGVRLQEVRPGVYEGDYTIRTRDRLTATSLVTARIARDDRVMNATLDQSLLRGAPSPVQTARIGAFTVNAPDRIRAGDELTFSLSGVPGGTARVAVEGITRALPLTEVSRGLYEGSYTVSRKDRLRGQLVATGFLKVGQKETSQRFVREQVANTYPDADGCDRRDRRDDRRADMVSANCGVVTAAGKAEIDDKDSHNVLGTVAGGVLGAVLGNQVGGGSGKDIARIVGALGGAYAGNRIQNAREKTTVYRVTVQMEDGSTKTFDHAVDPALAVGARVKIVDGAIVRRSTGNSQ